MLTVCTGRRCSSHGAAALLTALSLSPPPQMAVRGVGCSGACPPGRVVVCEGPDCPGPCMLLSAGDAGAVKRSAAEARRSLADLLGVDEVPPAAVAAVRLLQPLYEPLKAVSPSCTEALYPEFNEANMWEASTGATLRHPGAGGPLDGSAVWGGGIVLSRYMEELGSAFWEGKRVLELGTGTGLGSVTAAKLGAARVLATDRDGKVLALAAQNAQANGVGGAVSAAPLSWGRPGPEAADSPLAQSWDVVIGADDAMRKAGLTVELVDSPMRNGYGADKVKLFWVCDL
ncbi:hypothetical protein EMIHUDRAFT_234388 [Emiliania huxleyi CCMP1516]|uniref:Uncharacterized protein n=2 Tax=Emiliania huxleyi TaxID=2903 RepID=A0A0D3JZE1_EMIH1|nr:hypothetical protein EMIHUDRAFT_234388 [Emiliania huxleyi CCMP1516]EOD28876.1 hypothetical protein EMIHUDRAFT_234388 [Emiliania huxleyi CCMP1516]|eukprot:XP_005781305.1 hypothetical protein EMIHUDRAFT_234388 [Emiliania huxleyi CCMP1516]